MEQGNSLPETPSAGTKPCCFCAKNPLLLILLVITLVVLSSLGTYLVMQYKFKPLPPTPMAQTSPSPSVIDETANWKTFSSPSLPLTFKYSSNCYTIGKIVQDGTYHVFVSFNPIVIPETWDSPFTPMEIVLHKSDQDFNSLEQQAEGIYSKETLKKETLNIADVPITLLSGEAQGFFSGTKILQAFIQTKIGVVDAYYYGNIDTNFTETTFRQILSTFKFIDTNSPATPAGLSSYTAPSTWERYTTQDNLTLCLPPKWQSNPYGTLIYNRDTGYQPQITMIQSIPYSEGSYADAYYNFWKQEYPDVQRLVSTVETDINGNKTLTIYPKGEAKSSPEGLTVVWYAAGKLWKAGLSTWAMVNSSQTSFLKDFYTMISCSY